MSSSTTQIQPPPFLPPLSSLQFKYVPTTPVEIANQHAMIANEFGRLAKSRSGQAAYKFYEAICALAFQYTQDAQRNVNMISAAVDAGAATLDANLISVNAQRHADSVVAATMIRSHDLYGTHSHPGDRAHLGMRELAFSHNLAKDIAVAEFRHGADIALIYANRAAKAYSFARNHADYAEAFTDINPEAASLHIAAAASAVTYAAAACYVTTFVVPINFKLQDNIMIHMASAAAASAATAATTPVTTDPHGARRYSDAAAAAYAMAAATAYAATAPVYTAAAKIDYINYTDDNQAKQHTYNAECHARTAAYSATAGKPLLL